jgi:hypothetical protein
MFQRYLALESVRFALPSIGPRRPGNPFESHKKATEDAGDSRLRLSLRRRGPQRVGLSEQVRVVPVVGRLIIGPDFGAAESRIERNR